VSTEDCSRNAREDFRIPSSFRSPVLRYEVHSFVASVYETLGRPRCHIRKLLVDILQRRFLPYRFLSRDYLPQKHGNIYANDFKISVLFHQVFRSSASVKDRIVGIDMRGCSSGVLTQTQPQNHRSILVGL
jgi:hypothetical protein